MPCKESRFAWHFTFVEAGKSGEKPIWKEQYLDLHHIKYSNCKKFIIKNKEIFIKRKIGS